MKKIGILAVLAVAILGIGYFMIFGGDETALNTSKKPNPFPEQIIEDEAEKQEKQGVGTLDELRLLGENLECTIEYDPGEVGDRVEGTYFVHDGNMRGDFLTDAPDMSGQILSSMIITNIRTMYVWSEIDGELYGVEMNLSDLSDESINTNEPIKLDQAIDYNCKPWRNIDKTVFVPPADILFNDMGEVMEAGLEYGIEYEAQLEGFEIPEMP